MMADMDRRAPNLIITVIVTGVLTGIVSSIGTVAALSVRVDWAHETARQAHQRLDRVEIRVEDLETRQRQPQQ